MFGTCRTTHKSNKQTVTIALDDRYSEFSKEISSINERVVYTMFGI